MSGSARIVLTGATGFLGGALAGALARRGRDRVVCCGRPRRGSPLQARLERRLAQEDAPSPPRSWSFLELDLACDNPFQRAPDAEGVLRDAGAVLHAAADTSFTGWAADAINHLGARRIVTRIERTAPAARFVHISTAYVRGVRPGRRIPEHDGRTDDPSAHTTPYTASKAAAERAVEASSLSAVIARPSVIVGRPGGPGAEWITSLASAAAGLAHAPVDPDAVVDIVPVEHMVDCALALLDAPLEEGAKRVVNIAAGEASLRCADLVDAGAPVRDRTDPLRLIPPLQWDDAAHGPRDDKERRAMMRITPLLPFLNLDASFDNARCASLTGCAPPTKEQMRRRLASIVAAATTSPGARDQSP